MLTPCRATAQRQAHRLRLGVGSQEFGVRYISSSSSKSPHAFLPRKFGFRIPLVFLGGGLPIGPRDWELPQQVWINAMLWVLLAPFSHMVCKETIAGQRVVGPLYPLMHVNMHCRAVDGLQPHDVHQATNTVSSG